MCREGVGLAFLYYAPTTSLVAVPMGSEDVAFIFEENSSDFQQITVQGQLTYRISDPRKVSGFLNFSINSVTQQFLSDDPKKLSQRLINVVKVLTRKELQKLPLREALKATDLLVRVVSDAVKDNGELSEMGLEVLGLSFLAIKPTPETSRALEAEAREQILKEADEAVYARRNSAVEQERRIKENELNTEIAVESKKRQIRETQMEAERSVQQKQHELQQAEMASKVALEEKNTELMTLAMQNAKREADAKAYAAAGLMQAYANVDPKVLQALAMTGAQPGQMMALAFQELSAKAEKIGQLNITPDLLREVMRQSSAS